MPTFQLPKILQARAANQVDVEVSGGTVREALANLIAQFPALRPYFFSADNEELGAFLNLYLNGEDVRYLNGLATMVKEKDVLKILFSLAGG